MFDPKDNSTFVPIFAPYHDLVFEDDFKYAPGPPVPFLPKSEPHLAVYKVFPEPNGDSGQIYGAFTLDDAFWFNLSSAWVGCDSAGPDPCQLSVTGYKRRQRSSPDSPDFSNIVVQQEFTIDTCPELQNCELQFIQLGPRFNRLTGIRLEMVDSTGEASSFYLDDISGAWWNTSCEAADKRAKLPIHG
jgi:hypothetical protein